MGRVYRVLKVSGAEGTAEAKALFDTGAGSTFVCQNLAEKVGYTLLKEEKEVQTAAKGKRLRVTGYLSFDTEIEGYRVTALAFVSPELVEDMVIGLDLMEAHNIKVDPRTGKIDVSEFVELMIV